MLYIGLMSGTSMDAIDAVLADIGDHDLTVRHYRQFPIPATVQAEVRAISRTASIEAITRLDVVLGLLFAGAVQELLQGSATRPDEVHAIGSHGQTVLHLPSAPEPRTLQIGDPARIAVLTGITTVADFRRNDIAAGGQGAPLACAFHAWRFRDDRIDRIVLNLGGMANITLLPADRNRAISGFDTGPGNALMDAWTQQHLGRDYDADGHWAASGRCNEALLATLMADPYFALAPPKSTGKDDFNLDWLAARIAEAGISPAPADVQATLLELSARTISAAIRTHAPQTGEILACGGGVHNLRLMQRLGELLPQCKLLTTARHGIDPDAVEALTFAWLAKCRMENRPANLPAVTGASRPVVLGAIYTS